MSQETSQKCAIPSNRSFQATKIASFTESRRQRFLSLRKQSRESYFGLDFVNQKTIFLTTLKWCIINDDWFSYKNIKSHNIISPLSIYLVRVHSISIQPTFKPPSFNSKSPLFFYVSPSLIFNLNRTSKKNRIRSR